MKRFLTLAILGATLVSAPVLAEVNPRIHKLCIEAKDYAGCVKTMIGTTESVSTDGINTQREGASKPRKWIEITRHTDIFAGIDSLVPPGQARYVDVNSIRTSGSITRFDESIAFLNKYGERIQAAKVLSPRPTTINCSNRTWWKSSTNEWKPIGVGNDFKVITDVVCDRIRQ